jgi:hypothetical protein
MLDNFDMDTSPQIWIQRRDMADFAAEADPPPNWLQGARSLGHWHSPKGALSTALELALWALAGEPAQDGLFPWAEWSAGQNGLGPGHWSQWHLCHWHVSNGQVTLLQPSLPEPDALDRVWAELAEFIATDGLTLVRDGSSRAWVRGDLLAQLPTAHLDKVMGRPVSAFLPESRPLRRLQNELQMWFYTHPLLQGLGTPVNSVWICGTGALTPPLASLLDRLHWDQGDTPPPAGTRLLTANDEQAYLWDIGGASAWQKWWRHWRPLAWPKGVHELD